LTRVQTAAIFGRIMNLKDTDTSDKTYYEDVPLDSWTAKYVEAVTRNGMMIGYSNNNFMPNQAITRGELAVVFARYLGIDKQLDTVIPGKGHFNDLAGHWTEPYIETLYRYNIIAGYEDGSFKPNQTITRAEAVTMINRMLHRGPLPTKSSSFSDVPDTYWAIGDIEESRHSHHATYEDNGVEHLEGYLENDPIW
jgi:hypothetical protein